MSNITVGLKEWEDLELRAERAEQERDEARKALLWFAKKNPVPREFERVVIAAHVALLGGGEDE